MTHRQRLAAIVQHHWRIAESPLYPKGRGLATVRTTLASAGLHPTTGTSEGNRSSFCYQEPGPIALRATSLIPGASSRPLPGWEEQQALGWEVLLRTLLSFLWLWNFPL